jgi:hypothetical protein
LGFNFDQKFISVYINGELLQKETETQGIKNQMKGNLTIGSKENRSLNGTITEIKIINGAANFKEEMFLFNRNIDNNILGYWTIDEDEITNMKNNSKGK